MEKQKQGCHCSWMTYLQKRLNHVRKAIKNCREIEIQKKNEYGIKREDYDLEQKKKISKKKSCRKIN